MLVDTKVKKKQYCLSANNHPKLYYVGINQSQIDGVQLIFLSTAGLSLNDFIRFNFYVDVFNAVNKHLCLFGNNETINQ